MKATARCHIEVEIRMVRAMHAPQCRDRMKHYMLQIDRQIQNEEPDDDRGEARKVDIMQQSHPRCSTSRAKPTAPAGTMRRTRAVFSVVTPQIGRPSYPPAIHALPSLALAPLIARTPRTRPARRPSELLPL